MASIIVTSGDQKGDYYPLGQRTSVIGRAEASASIKGFYLVFAQGITIYAYIINQTISLVFWKFRIRADTDRIVTDS